MKKIRASRPQPECLDIRVVPSDLGVTPPPVELCPVPLLPAPPNPAVYPVPLLTLPEAPAGDGTAPTPGAITGPVSATITVGDQTWDVVGMTDGKAVILPTTGFPAAEGKIRMTFPDGTTSEYDGMINASDAAGRIRGVQVETDADGDATMTLPCRCTVPAIYPADLGVSA